MRPQAFWLLGLRWPTLRLAPLGLPLTAPGGITHDVRGRANADRLCIALGLEGFDREEEVAGRGLAWDGKGWQRLPLPTGPRRVLLVGDRPAKRSYGPRALEDACGKRLARIAGLDLAGLLWNFETANVGPDRDVRGERAGEQSAADLLVARARGRRIIILGSVADATLDAAGLARAGAASISRLPHPSGASPLLTQVSVTRKAGLLLLAETRGVRQHPPLPGRSGELLHATWRRLSRTGVAAAGPRGVPWWDAGMPGWLTSCWPGVSMIAETTVPFRWVVLPEGRQEKSGTAPDAAGAQLLAELEARRLGFADPWHALDARLARAQ